MTSPDKPDTEKTTEAAGAERTVVTGRDVGQSEHTAAAAPAEQAGQTGSAGAPAGAGNGHQTVTPPTDGASITSSAPPPWQRVTNDQYAGDRPTVQAAKPTLDETGPAEATARFEDWGYQRSPRSDAYTAGAAPTEAAGPQYPAAPPTATGAAYGAMAAGTAGATSARPGGVEPGSRTTVNFGAPATPTAAARPQSGAAPSALRRPGRGPRRASLQVKRVDPWSVLKLAFVLSVALFFVWLVAVGVLYGVLDGMGVWDRVNGTFNEFAQGSSATSNTGPLITASRVFGIAAIIGAINIVLFTALATVGSFVYNVSADLAGGLEITLAERE